MPEPTVVKKDDIEGVTVKPGTDVGAKKPEPTKPVQPPQPTQPSQPAQPASPSPQPAKPPAAAPSQPAKPASPAVTVNRPNTDVGKLSPATGRKDSDVQRMHDMQPPDENRELDKQALQPTDAPLTREDLPHGHNLDTGKLTNTVTSMTAGRNEFVTGPIDFNNGEQVQGALDKFVSVVEVSGGAYTHKGVCKKCGWQSHQYNEQDAKDMVRQHAMKHLREAI